MVDKFCLLYSFLHATHGNWRNALSIWCRDCPCGRDPRCAGFLLAADAEGRPILTPVELLRQTSGEAIDVDECVAVLDRRDFEMLYGRLIEWTVSSPDICPLLALSAQIPGVNE